MHCSLSSAWHLFVMNLWNKYHKGWCPHVNGQLCFVLTLNNAQGAIFTLNFPLRVKIIQFRSWLEKKGHIDKLALPNSWFHFFGTWDAISSEEHKCWRGKPTVNSTHRCCGWRLHKVMDSLAMWNFCGNLLRGLWQNLCRARDRSFGNPIILAGEPIGVFRFLCRVFTGGIQ